MIRLNVFVRVNETNREKAIEAAKELTACSLKEEGCIAEVLASHEKTAHFAQYVGIIQELAEMKLEKFEF